MTRLPLRALTVLLGILSCGHGAVAAPHGPTRFADVVLSPDGTQVASLEQGAAGGTVLMLRGTGDGRARTVTLPCSVAGCVPTAAAFAPGGHSLVVVTTDADGSSSLFGMTAQGVHPALILHFDGVIDRPVFDATGNLSVLATLHPAKRPGATQASAVRAGDMNVQPDEQRIARIDGGAVHFVSDAGRYVYDYDPLPGGGYIAVSAAGDGDANYWVATLDRIAPDGVTTTLFHPPQTMQLAQPRVSPDGRTAAFIGGLMSDFGSTGGDVYTLALDANAAPVNRMVKEARAMTATAVGWQCGAGLSATVQHETEFALLALDGERPRVMWHGGGSVGLGQRSHAIACAGGAAVTVREDFDRAPELAAALVEDGRLTAFHDVTQLNRGLAGGVKALSLTWKSDGVSVQGWYLRAPGMTAAQHPLIIDVHGGPSAAWVPRFGVGPTETALLARGYDLLLPNPRGSFGQGEAFASAVVHDYGGGPLRDILAGIDAVAGTFPVDERRLGLIGYSYGGYMAMWAPTQTDRFAAVAAGGGVSDWLSIEGEQGIVTSDIPFFGASIYDNPEPYLAASPVLHMKTMHTPAFVYVGERDIECPMPQSQEYVQALRVLGVPYSYVVYPGLGHGLADPGARADVATRTANWFARWFAGRG
ncbi:putative peptidase [Ameyamaea chiangmaiensis NBRC 103196]|uniref:S9 family peptidase n=1 Tax=Ameyamaea chiangmaiensis TaxID=442969 RepID=A0A850P996_9PROT|nr:prolyl oligopeptidase family serine peptidase [Ameyamaea chiangmaiensis]MBS4074477.1 S9 family peptidase [Ameyamaea chiangmaiensis]NVN39259.1 S9 family peptidase [Ameyamaea chiangmaiensis]GBQ72176.1 putative peptidase [Ameyamaea chiangmaiensis NBRC 103196]